MLRHLQNGQVVKHGTAKKVFTAHDELQPQVTLVKQKKQKKKEGKRG